MLRAVTTDLSVGPNGLSVKNSISETGGSSLSDADRGRDVAALQRDSPSASRSESPDRSRRAASSPSPSPRTETSLPRAGEPDAEGVLDGPQVFVGDSEEGGEPGFGQGDGVVRVRNRLCSLRPVNGTTTRAARAPVREPPVAGNLSRLDGAMALGPERSTATCPSAMALAHVLEAVLDGVRDRGALGLVPELPDDLAALVLEQQLQADSRVGRPAAPDTGRAPLGSQALKTLPSTISSAPFSTTLKPSFSSHCSMYSLPVAGGVAGLAALAVVVEVLDRDGLVLLQAALREVDPVGVLALRRACRSRAGTSAARPFPWRRRSRGTSCRAARADETARTKDGGENGDSSLREKRRMFGISFAVSL